MGLTTSADTVQLIIVYNGNQCEHAISNIVLVSNSFIYIFLVWRLCLIIESLFHSHYYASLLLYILKIYCYVILLLLNNNAYFLCVDILVIMTTITVTNNSHDFLIPFTDLVRHDEKA